METKARLDRIDIVGWLKTIPGFANAKGGTMYIGVEDKTQKLIGFDRKEADNERIFFTNQINEHIYPYPPIEIDFVPYENNGRELCIIRVTVHESTIKPILLKYKGMYGIFMRRGGYTNEADYEEMRDMFVSNRDTQYDSTDTGVEYDRSSFSKLLSYYSEHNDGKELSDRELKAVHFFNNKNMLKAGALLFMDTYDGERTAVQCSIFSGLTRGTERILAAKKFQGNIIDTIEFVLTFVDQRMARTIIKKDREERISTPILKEPYSKASSMPSPTAITSSSEPRYRLTCSGTDLKSPAPEVSIRGNRLRRLITFPSIFQQEGIRSLPTFL